MFAAFFDKLGEYGELVKGVHLSCSLSGSYQRNLSHQVPEDLSMETIWRHVTSIDQHKPFHTKAAKQILETINPLYVVHEVGYDSLKICKKNCPFNWKHANEKLSIHIFRTKLIVVSSFNWMRTTKATGKKRVVMFCILLLMPQALSCPLRKTAAYCQSECFGR